MSVVQDALETAYAECRRRRLSIVRIRSRRPITAAIVATYFSGKLTGKKTFVGIRRRVLRVRRLYVDRLWQLGRHALWLYQRGLSPRADEVEVERLVRAFRLAANCTPRSVIYSRPRTWAKACNRANFCPYCWEATSARQFQRIREIVNKILSVSSRQSFIAEYRVVERFVSARGIGGMHFVSEQERFAAIETLRAEIALTKQYISQQHKQFQRRTVGSIWRIVIIPHEIGWKLQLRQFWIAAADANFVAHPPPAGATIPRARTLNLQPGATWRQRKTTHSVDHHIYQMLIAFNTYPLAWLTEDIELVAVYLNAAAKMRLLGGTGLFKKIGSGLVKQCIARDAENKNNGSQATTTPARYAG